MPQNGNLTQLQLATNTTYENSLSIHLSLQEPLSALFTTKTAAYRLGG